MKNLKGIIIGIVLVGLCVGYFYYLANRDIKRDAGSGDVDVVEDLIQKDLVGNYPKTPREVVKLYNKALECFYNEDYSEDEFLAMADQARLMLDEELLASNPEDVYYESLEAEIAQYKENERTIEKGTVSDSDTIEYKTVQNREYATVRASYFIKEGKSYEKTYQGYMLRKDSVGQWKILYYDLIERDMDNEE